MKDVFEFKRFTLLFKKTIVERPVQLIGIIGLIFAATLIIYAVALYNNGYAYYYAGQALSFLWGFAIGGSVFASVIFGYFGTNASGAAYLTLPASTFEKWLCGALISGVLFTGVFLAFYRLMDICFVTACHNGLDKNSPQYQELFNAIHINTFDNRNVKQAFYYFVNFSGAVLVGSLYFNRVSFIKTALVYCGIIGFIFVINYLVARIIFKDLDMAFPFTSVLIKVGGDIGWIELPPAYSNIVAISFKFVIPAALWLTAFIRLKEKEI